MKRAQILQAVDDAFIDGVKELFTKLAINELSETPDEAAAQFERGIADFDDAHTRAISVIERVFPE